MILIILTPSQASQVRGRHGQYSELQPIELVNGNYGLPVEVLNDPDLPDVHDYLAALPVEEAEIKETEIPEELIV